MVNFSVFNEKSLPLPHDKNVVEKFTVFFKLLVALKSKGLVSLRLANDFKKYSILDGVNFQQFVGQQKDQDFKRKILSFLGNGIVLIESPIIREGDNIEKDAINDSEYSYEKQVTYGGMACCDVWNTIAVSFSSDKQWDTESITLKKAVILNDESLREKSIQIMHASKEEHLKSHKKFFETLETEIQLEITQENFWNKKDDFFPNIILFCAEIESQISRLDSNIFHQTISILRDVEQQRKLITDFRWSGEGKTVHNNPKLRKVREFTVGNRKLFFENHVKSLSGGYRIYFLQQGKNIYIGYIGKHLKNATN